VAELVKLNGLKNPDRVLAGAALKVPGGAWLCPVRGHHTVVDNWGAPRPGGRRHVGNDIFAARGTPVLAPVAGVIRLVHGAVAGNAFYLRGDDGVTYYGAHLDSYARGPGRVAAGEVVGAVGSTGNAAPLGAHLHFEIHPGGGAPVNPWFTLSKVC
jgi:murein DD-endopeptidase MepM/ murein hydrolase activator NlpD